MKDFRSRTPIVKCTVSGVRTPFYTCPLNCRAKIPLVFIVNANGTASVTLEIYKADTDSYFFILASKNFALGEYLQLSDAYIVLEPGDKLVLTCTGAAIDVDALCTAEETFVPVG
jgi:hypothetical protein